MSTRSLVSSTPVAHARFWRSSARARRTSTEASTPAAGGSTRSVAGPLAFYYVDQYAGQPASLFAPVRGSSDRYPGLKLLVLVRPDAVATVTVPASERRKVALLCDPAAWNDRNEYRIEDGDSAVTFEVCKKGETIGTGTLLNEMTQFNGGFLVAGVRCVPLDVLVRGQVQPIRVTLSFGAGRCA